MRNKLLAMVTILCVAVPAMSQAANWKLGVKAMTVGGSLSVRGGAPVAFANGTVYYNYTTTAANPNKVGVVAAATANSCYALQKVLVNGVATTNASTDFTPANGASQSAYAYFYAKGLTVSASVAANGGGFVTPTSATTFTCGNTPAKDLVYKFVPTASAIAPTITGVPAGASQVTNADHSVTVTIPAAYAATLTGNVPMVATFASVKVSAGTTLTALQGAKVSLAGSVIGTATPTYSWSAASTNPAAVTLSSTTVAGPTFNAPAVNGVYTFILTGNGGLTSSVNVIVDVSNASLAANLCANCHAQTGMTTTIYSNWSTSIHSRSTHATCQTCHWGTADGAHPGTVNTGTVNSATFLAKQNGVTGGNGNVANTGDLFCATCHTGAHPVPHPTTGLNDTCSACHTGQNQNGTGDAHQIQDFTKTSMTEAACQNCHSLMAADAAIVTNYNASVHKLGEGFASSCAGCHGGAAASANHPAGSTYSTINPSTFVSPSALMGGESTNVPAGTIYCLSCHKGGYAPPHDLSATAASLTVTCAQCHTATSALALGTGDAHAIQGSVVVVDGATGCINCHSLPQKAITGQVQDNSGVRAIVSEFGKWSHHVTGRTVRDSDCATCHLEGKVVGSTVVVDATYHMTGDAIHLRNCNTGLVGNQSNSTAKDNTVWSAGVGLEQYSWNPDSATPDHTAMDQFCMSCHNSNGAVTAIAAVGAANTSATVLNPFGDALNNQYDQIVRPAVVAVFNQFDTTNSSHHGVRGQKYNSATLSAGQFTNISTNNIAAGIKGVRGITGTMSSLSKMNTLYNPLGAAAGSLADTSTLHCGDCHTVGQYKQNSTYNASGTLITTVIGAHGSDNEYMLRKPDGSESHYFSNYSTGTATARQNQMVCYLCHNAANYQAADSHDGVGPCTADNYNTAGLVGHVRLAAAAKAIPVALGGTGIAPTAYTAAAYTNISTLIAGGHYGGTGNGNIFGNKCLNCHNSGATIGTNLNFGGIHGNIGNASYKSYSASTVAGSTLVQVTRQPYRFLPGLGNIAYNGGNSTAAWTQKSTNSINKSQGCYTLNGASASGATASLSMTYAAKSGSNISAKAVQSDLGVLGSWGACSDHAGTSTNGVNDAPTRSVLRPLTY